MPRKKKADSLAGRDTYHVVGPQGELAVKGEAAHALTTAQERAMRSFTAPVIISVKRRSLFGPESHLYQVIRDEHGAITTYTIDAQD